MINIITIQSGELIEAGEIICDIETDKAVVSFETDDDIILAKILVYSSCRPGGGGLLLKSSSFSHYTLINIIQYLTLHFNIGFTLLFNIEFTLLFKHLTTYVPSSLYSHNHTH